MPSKYDSLGDWLNGRSEDGPVSVSFAAIERIIETSLPPSARKHRPWWSNNLGNAFGRAMHAAGWRIAEVGLHAEQVAFARDAARTPEPRLVTGSPTSAALTPSATAIVIESDTPYAPASMPTDWFWEGNVQRTLVEHLVREGWVIVSQANTATHERGVDILARSGDRTLAVEVKGYPSETYRDPARNGTAKRTSPSLQMTHWFAGALHSIVVRGGTHPDHDRALAFPDFPRVRSLIAGSRWALDQLGIAVLLVDSEGRVSRI